MLARPGVPRRIRPVRHAYPRPVIQTALAVAVAAWSMAGGLSYLLTQAMVFYPWRLRIQRRVQRRADGLAGEIAELSPDYPLRLRNRLRTRYWMARVTADLPYCNTCVSAWLYAITGVLVWLYLGAPWHPFGAHALIIVPGAIGAAWLLWLIFAERLPGGHNALPDKQDVERDPPRTRVTPAP